ncbi:3'-5' exonuclease [Ascosphaera aggregata]|nr:3'-5' exonuclease [Ascosphaera aggregata]
MVEVKNLSSNWKKLQEQLKKQPQTTSTSAGTKSAPSLKRKKEGVAAQSSASEHDGNVLKKCRLPNTSLTGQISAGQLVPAKLKGRNTKRKMDSETETHISEKLAETKISSRRPSAASTATLKKTVSNQSTERNAKVNEGLSSTAKVGKYVAIDCEMVGVGPNADRDSSLARVSIVNYDGEQVYDSYVQQQEEVTDWRTHVSGITPKHMLTARPFAEVQRDVSKLLEGKILVGHAVNNDLNVLMLGHPRRDIRDTSHHPPYRKFAGGGSPKLKVLASELLGIEIQGAAHSSVEDARATMLLFRRDKDAFEKEHAKKWPVKVAKTREIGRELTPEQEKRKKRLRKKRAKK